MTTKCCKAGCERAATHHLGLRLWAKGLPKSSRPAEGALDMPLCRDHARSATADELLSDESWVRLCDAFRRAGKAEPDRASAECFPRKGAPRQGSGVRLQ